MEAIEASQPTNEANKDSAISEIREFFNNPNLQTPFDVNVEALYQIINQKTGLKDSDRRDLFNVIHAEAAKAFSGKTITINTTPSGNDRPAPQTYTIGRVWHFDPAVNSQTNRDFYNNELRGAKLIELRRDDGGIDWALIEDKVRVDVDGQTVTQPFRHRQSAHRAMDHFIYNEELRLARDPIKSNRLNVLQEAYVWEPVPEAIVAAR